MFTLVAIIDPAGNVILKSANMLVISCAKSYLFKLNINVVDGRKIAIEMLIINFSCANIIHHDGIAKQE